MARATTKKKRKPIHHPATASVRRTLAAAAADRWIGRQDVLADCFRAAALARRCRPSQSVLDVAPLPRLPVVRALYDMPDRAPRQYLALVGDDEITLEGTQPTWLELAERVVDPAARFDVILLAGDDDLHPRADMWKPILTSLAARLAPHGWAALAIALGPQRWTVPALEKALASVGLRMHDLCGVLGEREPVLAALAPDEARVAKALGRWFDDDILGAVFAPLAPAAARCALAFVGLTSDEEPAAPAPAKQPTTSVATPRAVPSLGHRMRKRVVGSSKPESGSRRPGSGAFIRERILAGDETDVILTKVHAQFPSSKATKSDVAWNKGRLRKEGKL